MFREQNNPSFNDPIISLINKERETNNLLKIQSNSLLTLSAYNRACYIFQKNDWSHDKFRDFISEAKYFNPLIGENLVRNYSSEEQAFESLMSSEKHKSLILNSRYTEIGVGRCGNVMVQHFGGR